MNDRLRFHEPGLWYHLIPGGVCPVRGRPLYKRKGQLYWSIRCSEFTFSPSVKYTNGMTQKEPMLHINEKWEQVAGLELASVRQKFAGNKGWWWNIRQDARRVEVEYRQFLYLTIANPGMLVIPWSRDLIDFWDDHRSEAQKYANDCQQIAGFLIKQPPFVRERSPAMARANASTRRLLKATFRSSKRRSSQHASSSIDFGSCDSTSVFGDSNLCASDPGHHGGHSGNHHSCSSHSCGGHGGGHGCGGHGCGSH